MRTIETMFQYELKKNKKLQEIMPDIDSMSKAEIMALPLMKWIREYLAQYRSDVEYASHVERVSEQLTGHVEHGFVADPEGITYRYDGAEAFVKCGKTELLVKTGDLVWFPLTGGVWIGTAYSEIIDPALQASTSLGKMTKAAYSTTNRAKINGDFAYQFPDEIVQNDDPNVKDYGLFRITRG